MTFTVDIDLEEVIDDASVRERRRMLKYLIQVLSSKDVAEVFSQEKNVRNLIAPSELSKALTAISNNEMIVTPQEEENIKSIANRFM